MSYDARTQMYLTQAQHDALKRAAQEKRVSMAEVVREAVTAYLVAEGVVLDPAAPDSESYLADAAWDLPGLATEQPGTGFGDAAERHDDHLYGGKR